VERTFAELLPIWRTIRESDTTAVVTPALDYVGGLELGALDVRFASEDQIAGVGETLRRFLGSQDDGLLLHLLYRSSVVSDPTLVQEYESACADAASQNPAIAAYVGGRADWLRDRSFRKNRIFAFFSQPGVVKTRASPVDGKPFFAGRSQWSQKDHELRLKAVAGMRDSLRTRLEGASIRSRELDQDDIWDLHFRLLNPTRAKQGVPRRVTPEDNVFSDSSIKKLGAFAAAYTEGELLVHEDYEEVYDDSGRALGCWRQGNLFRRVLTLKVLPEDGTSYYGVEGFLERLRDANGPIPYTLAVTVEVVNQRKAKDDLERRYELTDQLKGLLKFFQRNSVGQQAQERAQQESIQAAFNELTHTTAKIVTFSLSLLIEAPTYEELKRYTDTAQRAATHCGNAQLQDETWTQPQAFLSMLPSAGHYRLRKKGCTSRNAADFLPLFGSWPGTKRLASVFQTPGGDAFRYHPFCTSTGLNAFHSLVIADTGSGKSFTIGALLLDAIAGGADAVLVDDGCSWQRLTEVMGGVHVPLTLSSSIAPFVGYGGMLDEKGEIDPKEIDGLVSFIELVVQDRSRPEFDNVERNVVGKALTWCYETRFKHRPEARPLLGDFDDAFKDFPWEHPEDKRIVEDLRRRLEIWTIGNNRAFLNRPSNLRLDAPLLCFEMSQLGDEPRVRSIAMATILQAMTRRAQLRGRRETIIPIDEFHKYVRDDNATARVFEYRWRVARKFNQAMWAATQDIGSLLRSKAIEDAIVGNSPVRWFLRHGQGKHDDVVDKFKLAARAAKAFEGLEMKPGHYSDLMLMFGGLTSVLRLSVTPLAYWLLTTHVTDTKMLERVMEKNADALAKGKVDQLAVLMEIAKLYPRGVVGAS
jgi:hypothetical protein